MASDSARALLELQEEHRRRDVVLSRAATTSHDDEDDDDLDRECPIFDKFYAADGNAGIRRLTNFTAAEFRELYAKIHEGLVTRWNVGRGRKTVQTPMDVFFMTLVVLKTGGAWDVVSRVFEIKTPTFDRMITGFLPVAAKVLCERFVEPVAQAYSMQCLEEGNTRFQYFPTAIEAIDVTFQQANRPSGNMQEGKKYFSGKHKLYGYKVEVAVRPNGFAAAFSPHYPGSVSDISIMSRRIEEHRFRTEKADEDKDMTDDENEEGNSHTHWAVLADKGYQGAHEMMRFIVPHKKPPRGTLSPSQDRFNKKLSSDRIIVENFFGRLQSLWDIMAVKYRWSEKLYDDIVGMCIALTNVHIDHLPLRGVDGEWWNRYMNTLNMVGNEKKRKRSEQQRMYRSRRNDRLQFGFRETPSGST